MSTLFNTIKEKIITLLNVHFILVFSDNQIFPYVMSILSNKKTMISW